jgi:TIR domain
MPDGPACLRPWLPAGDRGCPRHAAHMWPQCGPVPVPVPECSDRVACSGDPVHDRGTARAAWRGKADAGVAGCCLGVPRPDAHHRVGSCVMRIFLSWSGSASRAVAVALREWLPTVLQAAEPYVSSEDIEKGARWSAEIAQQLSATDFGIICVTEDNFGSPWINFEAGALSKSVDASRVSPFLLDMRPTDLVGPLSQFQATLPELEDVIRLLRSINSFTERPVDEARLIKSVRMWWSGLEEQLDAIRRQERQPEAEHKREPTEMIEELLEITRGIQRRLLSSDIVEAGREVNPSNRETIARMTSDRTRLLEELIFAKLDAAFSNSHDVRFQVLASSTSGARWRLDAVILPLEFGEEELYLIELKYVSNSKNLLNRLVDGAGRLVIARRAYRDDASGPIRCIILFVLPDQEESLMAMLESQLGALPDEVDAIGMYESELRQITPSDLRDRLTAAGGHPDTS